MFDRLKSLIERGGKADTPVEAERRFIMPQAGGQGEARKQQPSSSMPRFKGSRSPDTVHARDIQSRLRMALGASQPVSASRFFAVRQLGRAPGRATVCRAWDNGGGAGALKKK